MAHTTTTEDRADVAAGLRAVSDFITTHGPTVIAAAIEWTRFTSENHPDALLRPDSSPSRSRYFDNLPRRDWRVNWDWATGLPGSTISISSPADCGDSIDLDVPLRYLSDPEGAKADYLAMVAEHQTRQAQEVAALDHRAREARRADYLRLSEEFGPSGQVS